MRKKSNLNEYRVYYRLTTGQIKAYNIRALNEKNAMSNALIYKIQEKNLRSIVVQKVEIDENI